MNPKSHEGSVLASRPTPADHTGSDGALARVAILGEMTCLRYRIECLREIVKPLARGQLRERPLTCRGRGVTEYVRAINRVERVEIIKPLFMIQRPDR